NSNDFCRVPDRFDEARKINWTPVWSLTTERQRWVPSALCFYEYPTEHFGEPEFARACSNGCAAGNSPEEAILQGLLELVERDACAIWWYNMIQVPSIDMSSFRDSFFDATAEIHRDRGRHLCALDLTNDLGIPVVGAVSWRTHERDRILIG